MMRDDESGLFGGNITFVLQILREKVVKKQVKDKFWGSILRKRVDEHLNNKII